MPLDLSEDQQKFIQKHFKSGGVFKSTKTANQKFNEDLQKTLETIYDRANAISKEIDDMGAKYEHMPTSLYSGTLEEILKEIPKTMKAAKKQLKNREIPSFADVENQLKELEDRLALRKQQILDGKNVDKPTDEDARLATKEKIADTIKTEIDRYDTATRGKIREIKAQTEYAFVKDGKDRDAKIAAYKVLYDDVSKGAVSYIGKELSNHAVTPETFQQALEALRNRLTADGDKLLNDLDEIAKRPQSNKVSQEQIRLLFADEYKDRPAVQREQARMAAIDAEKTTIDSALTAQKDKLKKLMEDWKEAGKKLQELEASTDDNKDTEIAKLQAKRKKMRGEREALKGNISNIEMRAGQLQAYKDDQLSREQRLVAMAELGKLATERADALPSDEVPDVDPDWLDRSEASGISADLVLKAIAELKTRVEAAAKREVVIPKLTKNENPIMELSKEEAATLVKMLDTAKTYTDQGDPALGEVLCREVRLLKGQFAAARDNLKMPPAVKPDPSPAKQLKQQLIDLEAKANDLWGLGADAATPLIKQCQDLRKQVADADLAEKFDETPDLFKTEVKTLADQIDELEVPDNPNAEELRKKAETATKQADAMSNYLDQALKTEPITSKDIIEVPGTRYEDKDLKHLVPADAVIMVDGVKHKILTKQGRGGQMRARRDDKDIPFEVLEAMHARNQALRAMAATDTAGPGAVQMLEDYTSESAKWLEQVEKEGSRVYPALEKIISDCDKVFQKGEVATYIPNDFGKVKSQYDEFKAGYLKKLPLDAEKEGGIVKTAVDALEVTAGKIKTSFEAHKKVYDSILADLTGKRNSSDNGAAVGKLMQDVLSRKPEDLFKGASDPAKVEELSKALKQFESVKAFYAKYAKTLSPKQMDGKWMAEVKAAYKTLDSKVEDNVNDAGDTLAELRRKINAFNDRMAGLDTAKGTDLATKLIEMCALLTQSAKAATEAHNKKVDFNKLADRLKSELATMKKEIKSMGKAAIAQQWKSTRDGFEAQLKAVKARMKADEAYGDGQSELETLERNMADLNDQMTGIVPGKPVKIDAARCTDRITTLETCIKRVQTAAKGLTDDRIKKEVDTMPTETEAETSAKQAVSSKLGSVKTNLSKIEGIMDLTAIKALGTKIDDALDKAQAKDNPVNTKADRVKLREQGLKEIRKIKWELEQHPVVSLYGGNPFDMASDLRVAKTALQQVEVAVLGCVNPKEPDPV